jgi:predicted Rossmann fold nucleotide-binding protein DprA/Smf involved in DNA uptake
MPVLEVIWNGAHQGRDCDLLNEALRVTPKLYPRDAPKPKPSSPRRFDARDLVLTCLPQRAADALTYADIAARTKLTPSQIGSAMAKLIHERLVQRAFANRNRMRSRVTQRYWRSDGGR